MSGLADIAARQQDQLIACRYMRQVTQPDTLNGLSGRTAQYEDCFQHGPRAIRPRQQVEILQNPVRRHSPLLATSWKPSRSKSRDQTGRSLHSHHLTCCFRPRCECKDITKADNSDSLSLPRGGHTFAIRGAKASATLANIDIGKDQRTVTPPLLREVTITKHAQWELVLGTVRAATATTLHTLRHYLHPA